MIKHFMILSSSYSSGMRIAMHYVVDELMDAGMLVSEVKKIKELCGESVSISTHFVETDSQEWSSVAVKDAFFEDVYKVESLSEFVELISKDRKLSGIDIAKYILSVRRCTHLGLEKLVYMCYADYLCKTGKRLFEDKIYAFRYGPVVETVYEKYKGCKDIEDETFSEEEIESNWHELPARSRILFAEDGVIKMLQIDYTLERYKNSTASELVDITHVKGGPWDSVYSRRYREMIPDEVIKQNHYKEVNFE